MSVASSPPSYEAWRTDPKDRPEDAAWAFGYYLIKHCRTAALASVPADTSDETRAVVRKAVDLALHNAMDLLEGFWKLAAGPEHNIELSLQVAVTHHGNTVETVPISPASLDLPIGYWAWVEKYVGDRPP